MQDIIIYNTLVQMFYNSVVEIINPCEKTVTYFFFKEMAVTILIYLRVNVAFLVI